MAGFYYEQSDPDRFQQLCQSLIVSEYPGVACYPVGQRDGGRDALQFINPQNPSKARLFQVKFVREPAKINDVHKWLESTIAEEAPKVENLLTLGYSIDEYILITNVPGTSYLARGTMDRARDLLAQALSVPSQMWWRDDIDRRCEANPKVVWAYPEMLRGVDILMMMAETFPDAYSDERYTALRKFIVEQYEEDSKVRFQQVELTNDLLSLFVDVPAVITNKPNTRRAKSALFDAAIEVAERIEAASADRPAGTVRRSSSYYGQDEIRVGAAALLLDNAISRLAHLVVLEGGPGQGKSTLGQFVCQVYRMKILKEKYPEIIDRYYRPASAKFPIKIDLREYATWLSGMNPFADDPAEKRPLGTAKSLEAFIAALITDRSGGMSFSVGDLSAVAQKSALLLVFDGLDEVADVGVRNRVVDEICATARRLRESAASLQVIVTTRPSALAEVAGFPANMFESWSLSSLTRGLIMQYAERWAVAENLKPKEYSELKRILNNKLDQAHMRELARNPMQLTILLSLIRTRGASLPDKRTTLYELYVDLFFAREAGKNEVVKQFRDELIDIHRYLAWVLHSEAEKGRALGKIESGRLLEVLRKYLIDEDQDPELANKLFHGVTQRVVFLVGAVEGQYKFEVQPLREYFAAKFLYEDAPHSSVGNPKPGTIDERFDAIARNTYWQNVTRFFAGCFNKGELPALVERLQVLSEEGDLALTHYPRAMAATLAADWVFSRNQRSLKHIIQLVLARDGYRSLFGSLTQSSSRGEPLVLPDGCGRSELLDRCFEVLRENRHADIRFSIAQLAQANSSVAELKIRWLNTPSPADVAGLRAHLLNGYALGALSHCTLEDVLNLSDLERLRSADLARVLAMAGRYDLIDKVDFLVADFLEDFLLRGTNSVFSTNVNHELAYGPMLTNGPLLDPLGFIHRESGNRRRLLSRHYGFRLHANLAPSPRGEVRALGAIADILIDTPSEALASDIGIWRGLIALNAGLAGGDDWLTVRLAHAAVFWVRDLEFDDVAYDKVSLTDASVDVIFRIQRATKSKGVYSWWKGQFDAARTDQQRLRVLQIAFLVCGPLTLIKLVAATEEFIESLSFEEMQLLASLDRVNQPNRRRNRRPVTGITKMGLKPRSVALLMRFLLPTVSAWSECIHSLQDYGGNDPFVHDLLLLGMAPIGPFGQEVDDEYWVRLAKLSKIAYESGGGELLISHLHARPNSSMPIDLAREIAGNREQYPQFLISLAESSCLRHLANNAIPLADVAKSAWWPE
ncbi:hypothetical protein GCM10009733_082130 [Nonomuraea maheshkhaliensis]|uniref:NACHT domain-containing protein n=1 Tax=Nonomuraea maheshkhaliensis TaxID=419590 RepID=A0ABN2GJZ8_9ACTN